MARFTTISAGQFGFLICAAIGLIGLRPAAAADQRSTLGAHESINKRFIGRWVAERLTIKGNDVNPGNLELQKAYEWNFETQTYTLRVGDEDLRKFEYKVDTTKSPWHFDIKYVGDDPQMQQLYAGGSLGICRFVDGKFERCYCQAGADKRPTEFKSTAENEMNLVVLVRVVAPPAATEKAATAP